jgi:hypothetical protein
MPGAEEIKELDQAMSKSFFDGVKAFTEVEPGEGASEEELEPGKKADDGAETAKAQEGDKGSEGGEGKKEGGEEPPKRMFQDLDDAEKKYKGLQRSFAEKDRRINELQSKLQEQETEEAWQRKVTESTTAIKAKFREIEREKLQRINELDADAEDYDDQVADILADALVKRTELGREYPEVTTSKPAKPKPAEQEPSGEEGGETDEAVATALELLDGRLKEEGIPADDIAWNHFKSLTPSKDEAGEPIPFEEQVNWAIKQTREYYARMAGTKPDEESAEEKARKRQEADLPLGATGGDHLEQKRNMGGKPAPAPKSLDDVLEEVRRDQTL